MKRPDNKPVRRGNPGGAVRGFEPARDSESRARAAFTLIEVLTVISIMGVLAAIGAGLGGVANRKMKESTVKAQRDQLATAIESYRADFNQYPPDNAKDGFNLDPVLNPLYYELVGTVSTNQGRLYRDPGREQAVPAQEIRSAFGVEGFVNSVEAPNRPKTYLTGLKASQHSEVQLAGNAGPATVELLIIPVAWPGKYIANSPLLGKADRTAPVAKQLLNPWRYVSTKPTNNPAGFDLWADYWVGKQRRVIGNWKE